MMDAMAMQMPMGGEEEVLDLSSMTEEFLAEGGDLQDLEQIITLLQAALENPQAYPQIYQQLLQADGIDDDDLPPQYDEQFLSAVLDVFMQMYEQLASMGMQGGMPQQPVQQFAGGGLAQIARMGRRGDTRLAHVTPQEERLLMALGGSGTINPYTGQPEFFLKKLKKAFKKIVKSVSNVVKKLGPVVPLALNFIAPGIGSAIGGWANSALGLGLGAAGQAALGGGLLGGGLGALTGGGKGAILGALGGGLGGYAGAGGFGDFGKSFGFGGASVPSGMPTGAEASLVGEATGSVMGPGLQASGATVSPIAMTPPPASYSLNPFVAAGQKAFDFFGSKPLSTGFDIANAGLDLYGNAQGIQQQKEMSELQKQVVEKILRENPGMSPEEAQAQVIQQGGLMGTGNAFGDVGGMYSNWSGVMSPYYQSGV